MFMNKTECIAILKFVLHHGELWKNPFPRASSRNLARMNGLEITAWRNPIKGEEPNAFEGVIYVNHIISDFRNNIGVIKYRKLGLYKPWQVTSVIAFNESREHEGWEEIVDLTTEYFKEEMREF